MILPAISLRYYPKYHYPTPNKSTGLALLTSYPIGKFGGGEEGLDRGLSCAGRSHSSASVGATIGGRVAERKVVAACPANASSGPHPSRPARAGEPEPIGDLPVVGSGRRAPPKDGCRSVRAPRRHTAPPPPIARIGRRRRGDSGTAEETEGTGEAAFENRMVSFRHVTTEGAASGTMLI